MKESSETSDRSAWVGSLPRYRGPQPVHALQIFYVEKYGKRDDKHQVVRGHPAPPVPAPTAPGAGLTVKPAHAVKGPTLPDRGTGEAVALITPREYGFAPFEVDESYLRLKQPMIGGFYIVYEDGSDGFASAAEFNRVYTLVLEDVAPDRDERPDDTRRADSTRVDADAADKTRDATAARKGDTNAARKGPGPRVSPPPRKR